MGRIDNIMDVFDGGNLEMEEFEEMDLNGTPVTFTKDVPTGTGNGSKGKDDYDYDMDTSIKTFYWDELIPTLIVYSLTFVLGLVGNVLIIFTISRYRKMKSTTNVFLASLASSDLLLILFCIPVKGFHRFMTPNGPTSRKRTLKSQNLPSATYHKMLVGSIMIKEDEEEQEMLAKEAHLAEHGSSGSNSSSEISVPFETNSSWLPRTVSEKLTLMESSLATNPKTTTELELLMMKLSGEIRNCSNFIKKLSKSVGEEEKRPLTAQRSASDSKVGKEYAAFPVIFPTTVNRKKSTLSDEGESRRQNSGASEVSLYSPSRASLITRAPASMRRNRRRLEFPCCDDCKHLKQRIVKLEKELEKIEKKLPLYPVEYRDSIKTCLERLKATSETVLKRLKNYMQGACSDSEGKRGKQQGKRPVSAPEPPMHEGNLNETTSRRLSLRSSNSDYQLNVGMEITMENIDPITGEKIFPTTDTTFQQEGNIRCKLYEDGEDPLMVLDTDFQYNPKTGMLFKNKEATTKDLIIPLRGTIKRTSSRTNVVRHESPEKRVSSDFLPPDSTPVEVECVVVQPDDKVRTHRVDEMQHIHLPDDVQCIHRPNEMQCIHRLDEMQHVHRPDEMHCIHQLDEMQHMHQPDDVQCIHRPSEMQHVHRLDELQRVHRPNDVQRVHRPDDKQRVHRPEEMQCMHRVDDMQRLHRLDERQATNQINTELPPKEARCRSKSKERRREPDPGATKKRMKTPSSVTSRIPTRRKATPSPADFQSGSLSRNSSVSGCSYWEGTEQPIGSSSKQSIKLAKLFSYSWNFGFFLCKLVHYMQSVSAICSVLTLTAMSLERYYAIVHPMKAQYICTTSQARRIITGTWVSAFLLAVPILFAQVLLKVGVKNPARWCVRDWDNLIIWRAHELYMMLLILVIPTGVMAVAYTAICWEIWEVIQRRQDMTSGKGHGTCRSLRFPTRPSSDSFPSGPYGNGTNRLDKRRGRGFLKREITDDGASVKQVIKMLVAVVVIYVLCWGPMLIDNVLQAYGILSHIRIGGLKYMGTTFHLLAYFNSCINPFIYGFMSKNFRDSFRKALCCGRKKPKTALRSFSLSQTRNTSIRYAESSFGRNVSIAPV